MSCTSRTEEYEEVERLASGGKQNLQKLYLIAAKCKSIRCPGPPGEAILKIAEMGSDGTPYLLYLLGPKPEEVEFVDYIFTHLLHYSMEKAGDDRALLALIYITIDFFDRKYLLSKNSIIGFYDYLQLYEKAKIRDGYLPDIVLWWLKNKDKYPDQILPKQWPKSMVLKTLIAEIEKYPKIANENRDLINKTLTEIAELEKAEKSK